MPPRCIVPLILVAALAVAPARAGKAPAPEAADQTLGMAILSASVDASGALSHGAGVVSVQPLSPGLYDVTFARSLAGCDFVVSASNTSADLPATYTVMAKQVADDRIVVQTTALGVGFPVLDSPFSVIAFCTR